MSRRNENPLALVKLDFRHDINCQQHNTSMYRIMYANNKEEGGDACLVVRRGADFVLDCTFSENYDTEKYRVLLSLEHQRMPGVAVSKRWATKIQIHEQDKRWIRFIMSVPVNAPIGEYTPVVFTIAKNIGNDSVRSFTITNTIYVIFNPFNPQDPTFVPDENDRRAYVLSDRSANMFPLNDQQITANLFFAEQFHPRLIWMAFYLLNQSGIPVDRYNDPVIVARFLAHMNSAVSKDDIGFIFGNWGEIVDYMSPVHWTATYQLVSQYMQNNHVTAKYGQCFVFANALTGLLRAIGYGARSIMSAPSGNDLRNQGKMIFYFDVQGEKLKKQPTDEYGNELYLNWNYHMFNEIFLRRDDIRSSFPEYADPDWQVLDSTPEGMYDERTIDRNTGQKYVRSTGPVPRKAVFNRNDDVPYEASIVRRYVMISQENIVVAPNGNILAKDFKKDASGHRITTYDGSRGAIIDVKNFYKHPNWYDIAHPGSQPSSRSLQTKPFKLDVIQGAASINAGQPYTIQVHVLNNKDAAQEINVCVNASLVEYNGRTIHRLDPVKKAVKVGPNAKDMFEVKYEPAMFGKAPIQPGLKLQLAILASVDKELEAEFLDVTFNCPAPETNLVTQPPYAAKSTIEVGIKFTNPLSIPLTNASFKVNDMAPIAVDGGTVQPGQTVTASAKVVVANNDFMSIGVAFSSNEYKTTPAVVDIKDIQNVDKSFSRMAGIEESTNKQPNDGLDQAFSVLSF